jgi:hypothetical protein
MTEYEKLLEYRKSQRDALFVQHGDDWRKYELHPGKFWHAGPLDEKETAYLLGQTDA